MKTIFKIKLFLLITIILSSCSNDSDSLNTHNQELKIIKKESDYLSKNALKIGIKNIKVQENKILINSKSVKFNGQNYIIPNYGLEKTKQYFEIKLSKDKSLIFDKKNKEVKVNFDGKKLSLDEIYNQNFSDKDILDITVMLTVAEDMFIDGIEREKSLNLQSKCGDWTYINAGVGRNSADARLTREVNEVLKENKNCKRLSDENDTSCVWENSACIATTEIECQC